jgi:PAS domain S-box-containing protein
MKLTFRKIFAMLCTAALFSVFFRLSTPDAFAADQETKRVFVLNSFDRGYTWTDNMMLGIDDAFSRSGIKIETYATFMDMKRIAPSQQYFSKLKELIREKYKGVRFDAVLACDNDALEFISKYRDELFPGLPLVFSSVNDYDERMLDGRKDITGTSENTDYAGTIGIALKLRPATKSIVVVTDNTTTGKAHRSAIEKIRPSFPQSIGFTYFSLGDMTMAELALKLSGLDSASIVLLLQHFMDKNRVSHTVQQSTPLLAKSASVPVFVLTDIRMGLGTLGGHVVSGYHHGEAAAQMVLKILCGTDVGTIPVLMDSPNKYMFDYSVMQRFNIAERDLPQGSILLNRPVSILNKYKTELLLALGLFIIVCTAAFGHYISIIRFNHRLILSIAERKKVEELLRKNQEMLRCVLDTIPQSVFWKDSNGVYMGCNKVFAKTVALGSPEDIVGKTDFDLPSTKAEAEAYRADDKYVISNNTPKLHIIEQVRRADGTRIWADTSKLPLQNDLGEAYGVLGVYEDITERNQAEEALRESEERFRRAVVDSPFPIMLHAEDGKILQTSNSWSEITGYTREELVTVADWTERAYGESKMSVCTGIDALYSLDQRKYEGDYTIRTKSGGSRIWEFSSAPLGRLPDGRRLVMSMAMDVTERRQAEEEKARLEVQLRQSQKMEAVGQLAGGISHDFNNLLSVINGYSQVLLLEADLKTALREKVEEILRAGERAARLTRQLLLFSRRQPMDFEIIDLNAIVSGMNKMLRRLIPESIDMELEGASDLWLIKSDPGHVEQVIMNLVINARDAMSDGGALTLKTGNVEIDESNFLCHHSDIKPGAYVMLSVSDTGCGMDANVKDHIFEPFFTTKEAGKGTGLGLATVYGIVKQSNAYIDVKSELGKGTKFRIYFPKALV